MKKRAEQFKKVKNSQGMGPIWQWSSILQPEAAGQRTWG